MHMADALLSPGVAGVMYAASAVAAGHSVHKLEQNRDTTDKIIPTMGVMGAFVFAAQMINFTIPGTGSSGHLCGGMLLTAIVGPYAAFLTMIGVLLIQCLLFADGGLMALNDRLKLRSLVVGEQGDTVYLASEESAIRTIAPDLDRLYAPRGGEPVIVTLNERSAQ